MEEFTQVSVGASFKKWRRCTKIPPPSKIQTLFYSKRYKNKNKKAPPRALGGAWLKGGYLDLEPGHQQAAPDQGWCQGQNP
jgi:hypothetical protein